MSAGGFSPSSGSLDNVAALSAPDISSSPSLSLSLSLSFALDLFHPHVSLFVNKAPTSLPSVPFLSRAAKFRSRVLVGKSRARTAFPTVSRQPKMSEGSVLLFVPQFDAS